MGEFLAFETEKLFLYFSQDFGQTWKEIKKGNFYFGFIGLGEIMILADRYRATDTI